MATYTELASIADNPGWGGLVDKIRVAVAIKAAAVINETTPPASRLEWANAAIQDPGAAANDIAYFVVVENSSASIANIISASDSAVQTNVDAAIDKLYRS